MTSVLVSYPLDVVRCRLSAQQDIKMYAGIWDALKVIYKQEGVAGLYRGLTPTLYVCFEKCFLTHCVGNRTIRRFEFHIV